MKLTWHLKKFNQLSHHDLFQIFYDRVETFIVSQNRVCQEMDKTDLIAHHLYALDDHHNLVAYARFFPNHDNVSFGRVLVVPGMRGKGLGLILVHHLLRAIRKFYGNGVIVIYSQYDKRNFYRKVQFETVGKPFIYAHTKHIKMVKHF